jgi:hypothetical protein
LILFGGISEAAVILLLNDMVEGLRLFRDGTEI